MINSPKWDADYIHFWRNLKYLKHLNILSFDLSEFPGCEKIYPEIGEALKGNATIKQLNIKLENIGERQ